MPMERMKVHTSRESFPPPEPAMTRRSRPAIFRTLLKTSTLAWENMMRSSWPRRSPLAMASVNFSPCRMAQANIFFARGRCRDTTAPTWSYTFSKKRGMLMMTLGLSSRMLLARFWKSGSKARTPDCFRPPEW